MNDSWEEGTGNLYHHNYHTIRTSSGSDVIKCSLLSDSSDRWTLFCTAVTANDDPIIMSFLVLMNDASPYLLLERKESEWSAWARLTQWVLKRHYYDLMIMSVEYGFRVDFSSTSWKVTIGIQGQECLQISSVMKGMTWMRIEITGRDFIQERMGQTLGGRGSLLWIKFQHWLQEISKSRRILFVPFVLLRQDFIQSPWLERFDVPEITWRGIKTRLQDGTTIDTRINHAWPEKHAIS